MIRSIRYKISEDTKGIEPKTRQWAGMQYEDNATEIQFDISAIIHSKGAVAVRIDFNSAAAGYHPSENLTTRGGGIYSREIPKYITQYGGELQVTAVITVENSANTGATDIVYSYPVTVYFTPVEKSENGNTDVEGNISEMENAVKEAETNTLALAAETKRLANEMAILYENIVASDVTADKLADTKREAEDLIYTVEKKLDSGAFVGEQGPVGEIGPIGPQGPKGDKGEKGDDAVTDQSYNPESPNAQSGIAVAEALSNVGGGGKGTLTTIANITLTEEVNSVICADANSFADIGKVGDFYIKITIPMHSTKVEGHLFLYINRHSVMRVENFDAGYGYKCVNQFYSINIPNVSRMNMGAAKFSANETGTINLTTTSAAINESISNITVGLGTASSMLPIGTNIRIVGWVE